MNKVYLFDQFFIIKLITSIHSVNKKLLQILNNPVEMEVSVNILFNWLIKNLNMRKLVQNYMLQEPIGKGVYGQVYKAVHQKNQQLFAVKVIPKASFRSNPKLQQLAINQINILSSLKHENIVRFIETLKTPNNFYFVYEYCNDGTIQNMLQKKKFLKQNEALIIFRQLLEAFKELNKNNIMHRDLKPDNIFLSNGKVKLGDFGFCKMLQVNMAQTMLGSPIYMAPQILKQQIYTSKADIWSLGVVLFELLFGFCPYESSSISQLINVIKQNELSIPKQINYISQNTQGLLRKMLVKDQFKRIEWVDLFDYKIDESGNILSGYNKQMGIEALEKYFLHDIKSAGEIIYQEPNAISVNPYLDLKPEQIGKERKRDAKQQDEDIPSLKSVISMQKNKNYLLASESLGKAGPGPSSIPNYEVKEFTYKSPQPLNQQLHSNRIPLKENKNRGQSFLQKHSRWTDALQLVKDLSQKGTAQNDKLVFWIVSSLMERLDNQQKKYPEWTDVIMQEKQQIALIIKELESLQINKENDKKNEILKLWSRSTSKREKNWDRAVQFIFGEDYNIYKSAQEILLS